jgi:hypothetical protein
VYALPTHEAAVYALPTHDAESKNETPHSYIQEED